MGKYPQGGGASQRGSSRELDAIMDRLRMYEAAAKAAKEQGDSSKARRYNRAIAAINDMAKKVRFVTYIYTCTIPYQKV